MTHHSFKLIIIRYDGNIRYDGSYHFSLFVGDFGRQGLYRWRFLNIFIGSWSFNLFSLQSKDQDVSSINCFDETASTRLTAKRLVVATRRRDWPVNPVPTSWLYSWFRLHSSSRTDVDQWRFPTRSWIGSSVIRKKNWAVHLLSKDPMPTYLIEYHILPELELHRFARAIEKELILEGIWGERIGLTARYTCVPFIMVCATELVNWPEMPKSQILNTTGFCLTKIFDGFTSRWRIPLDFKNWRASTICNERKSMPIDVRSFHSAHVRDWSCAWGVDRYVLFLSVYASKHRTSP